MWGNGQLGELIQYKNGKLDGLFIRFHEDGKLAGRFTYKDGVKVED